MNICLLTETQSGCYKWRGAIPAKYLSQRGHQVQILSNQESYQAPDVVVLYRAHYPQAVKIVEWCKRNRIRVVFDTDDALDLVPPENLNYKAVQSRLPLYEFLLTIGGRRDHHHRNPSQLPSQVESQRHCDPQ